VRNSLRGFEGVERAFERAGVAGKACVEKAEENGKREGGAGGGCGGSTGTIGSFVLCKRERKTRPSIFQKPSRARVAAPFAYSASHTHARARARSSSGMSIALPVIRAAIAANSIPYSRESQTSAMAPRCDDSAGSASDESNQVDSQMCLSSELRRSSRWNASYPTSARERGIPIAMIAARLFRLIPRFERPSRSRLRPSFIFFPVPYDIFVCSRQRLLLRVSLSFSRERERERGDQRTIFSLGRQGTRWHFYRGNYSTAILFRGKEVRLLRQLQRIIRRRYVERRRSSPWTRYMHVRLYLRPRRKTL